MRRTIATIVNWILTPLQIPFLIVSIPTVFISLFSSRNFPFDNLPEFLFWQSRIVNRIYNFDLENFLLYKEEKRASVLQISNQKVGDKYHKYINYVIDNDGSVVTTPAGICFSSNKYSISFGWRQEIPNIEKQIESLFNA